MTTCKFCRQKLHLESANDEIIEPATWVDGTEGDTCSGDDDTGKNENEMHVPDHADRIIGQIEVCIDCAMVAANGATEDLPADAPTPLGLIGEGYDVTFGVLEHAPDCEYADADEDSRDDGAECLCGQISFSWSACEGCGSVLGGTRGVMVLWEHSAPAHTH